MTTNLNLSLNKLVPLLIMAGLTCIQPGNCQTEASNESHDQIKQIVDRIFAENIKQGTRTIAPGIEAYTRVPLSHSEILKITVFGDKAIPVLADCLDSPKVRFKELAILCLGNIRGSTASHLLERVTLSSDSQVVRIQALEWLGSLPGEDVTASLKKITQASNDPSISNRAAKLLITRHAQR